MQHFVKHNTLWTRQIVLILMLMSISVLQVQAMGEGTGVEQVRRCVERSRLFWNTNADSAELYMRQAAKVANADGSSEALGWLNAAQAEYCERARQPYLLYNMQQSKEHPLHVAFDGSLLDSLRRHKVLDYNLKAYDHLSTVDNDSLTYLVLGKIVDNLGNLNTNFNLDSYITSYIECGRRISYKCEGEAIINAIAACCDKGSYSKAIGYAANAIDLYTEKQDSMGISRTFYCISFVHYHLRNYEMVKTYAYKALLSYSHGTEEPKTFSGGETAILYSIYNMLCIVCIGEGDFGSALEYSKRTVEISEQNGNTVDLISALNNLGYIYNCMERYSDAVKCYNDALAKEKAFNKLGADEETERTLNFRNNKAITYLSWGRVYEASREMDIVMRNIDKVVDFAQKHEAYTIMSDIAYTQSDFRSAFNSLKQAIVYSDSMYDHDKNMAILELQVRLDSKIKDLENDNLKYVLREVEYQSTKQRMRFMSVSGVLVLLLVVTFMVIWGNKRRQALIEREKQKLVELKNEIQHINAELLVANATKDKLFATIAHDLRNPCMALLSISNDLTLEQQSSEQRRESIDIINQGVNQLYGLLETLLQWSQDQFAGANLQLDNVDVNEVIDQEVKYLNMMLIKKHIALSKHGDSSIFAYVNKHQISVIVRNLITNAIKFTPQGGIIDVQMRQSAGYVEIIISDTGSGIPGYREGERISLGGLSSTKGTDNETGFGLGLNICLELVERNNGQIWAQNRPQGGACFHVLLPQAHQVS